MIEGSPLPSFTIALETANLDVASVADLRACLESIAEQKPAPADANEVVLVNDGRVDATVVEGLEADFPWLRIRLDERARYVGMKLDTAARATGEVVVLCDSDVRYLPGWLDGLLRPFVDPSVACVAGETTTPISGPYSLAIALTFVFPRWSRQRGLQPTNAYWNNNVAFRRTTLLDLPPVDDPDLYRGHTAAHSASLAEAGIEIVRNPAARAVHLVLDPRAVPVRYFRLGRDAAVLRHGHDGAYDATFPPDRGSDGPFRKLARRTVSVVAERPARLVLLPLALPIVAVAGGCWAAGYASDRPRRRRGGS